MTKNIFMRADRELLKEIKLRKINRGESYAQVIKRILDKEKREAMK